MQYSVVNFKTVKGNVSFRIDADFYRSDYLIKANDLSNFITLNKIATITDGDHSKFPENQNQDIRYLRAKDIKNNFLSNEDSVFVSNEYFKKQKRSLIKEDNVLLSIMGSVGEIAITPKNFHECIANRAISIIKDIKIKPYYLFTFLLTKYGFNQISRYKAGGIQERINLDDLEKIEIVKLSNDFQKIIEKIINRRFELFFISESYHSQAEQLLFSELGLLDWKPKHELTFIKNFSDIQKSDRFDAEYFQPKYEEIIEAIEKYKNGFSELKTFVSSYSTGFPFSSESYTEDGIYLIRINNIQKGILDLSNAIKIPLQDMELSKKDVAKENDILISMSGTIGNSCKIPVGVRAVINQRIFRFTPKKYNVDVLPLLINSVIGLSQLSRIGTGGVQTNISGFDILKIKIPILNQKIQEEIANKIIESEHNKSLSKSLLEIAKQGVEMAIEKNEQEAEKWINDKIEELGIKL